MMQNLDSLEQATRDSAIEMIRELNRQLAGLDAERDGRISEIRAEYMGRRRTLKGKRTEWLRRVKGLLGQLTRSWPRFLRRGPQKSRRRLSQFKSRQRSKQHEPVGRIVGQS